MTSPSLSDLGCVSLCVFLSRSEFRSEYTYAMLARFVVPYDIKLEEDVTRPRDLRIGTSTAANPTARVTITEGCLRFIGD